MKQLRLITCLVFMGACQEGLGQPGAGILRSVSAGPYYTRPYEVHPDTRAIMEKYHNFEPKKYAAVADRVTIPEPIQRAVTSNMSAIDISEDGGLSWRKAAFWGAVILVSAAFIYQIAMHGAWGNASGVDDYGRHVPLIRFIRDDRYVFHGGGQEVVLPKGTTYDPKGSIYHYPPPAGTRYAPVSGGLFEEPQSYWE